MAKSFTYFLGDKTPNGLTIASMPFDSRIEAEKYMLEYSFPANEYTSYAAEDGNFYICSY